MFDAGSQILVRTVIRDRVRFAEPALAVVDDGESVVFFRPYGTPMKVPTATLPRDDPERVIVSREEYQSGLWDHHDVIWEKTNVLVIAQPGSWWSTWLFWDAVSWVFLAWYVNFELPLTRTRFGFDTKDLSLDLVVTPDGDIIEKDRDDYEERVRLGFITSDEAAEVERATIDARRSIADRDAPFDGSWQRWRPDPSWPLPQLPTDWATV